MPEPQYPVLDPSALPFRPKECLFLTAVSLTISSLGTGAMASPAVLRLLAVSALLLLCAPTTSASATPSQLVDSIRRATAQGQALQAPAQSITIINGPLIVVDLGPYPLIIAGLTKLNTDLNSSIAVCRSNSSSQIDVGLPLRWLWNALPASDVVTRDLVPLFSSKFAISLCRKCEARFV